MINFIGLGAQKSGTSWAYTCLYEHPEVCIPVKEIHFFSRPRYSEGKEWYESHFKKCDVGKLRGEWSTSYLYSEEAPERIRACYPNAKLLAILRNPTDRAYSQYRNAIRGGHIPKTMTFEEYSANDKSVWDQGLYAKQLKRYLALFPKEQILVLIYEDIKKDPVRFMQNIHEFLGIQKDFVASMINEEVNIARTPTFVWVDRVVHHISEFLRRHGFDRFVHMVRRTGVTDFIRSINTIEGAKKSGGEIDISVGRAYLVHDVRELSNMIGRDMVAEWGFDTV